MKAATKMSTRTVDNPKIVSREKWLVARKKLLAREKQLTRERDAVAAERRQLPWVKVDKNYVFDTPAARKRSPIFSTAKASSSFITSCLVRTGRKPAPAAPSTWIIPTRRWCISRSATSLLPPSLARQFPKSKRSKSAWVGSSIGFPLSEVISTTTITSPSLQGIWPKAKSTTTLLSSNSQARKLLESAFSTRTTTGTSSTPIPPMLAVPKPR